MDVLNRVQRSGVVVTQLDRQTASGGGRDLCCACRLSCGLVLSRAGDAWGRRVARSGSRVSRNFVQDRSEHDRRLRIGIADGR